MLLIVAQTALDELAFGNITRLHPIGGAALAIACLSMLTLPRQWALLPLILLACFVPSGQRLVLFTLDFSLLRIALLVGWIRVLIHGEYRGCRVYTLDWVLVVWALTRTTVYGLQWDSSSALFNRLGISFDAIGTYVLVRCLVREWTDIIRLGICFALCAIPVSIFFVVEWTTKRNLFAAFGGVPWVTDIREGRLRCQGAFSHPILAGCFWAGVIPLMAGLWWMDRRLRYLAVLGSGSALVIIFCCSSSTPVTAFVACLFGAAMYRMRRRMSWVVMAAVCLLVVLHFSMQKPVWHLVARLDFVGGSTGWHRYHLIDKAIANFHEWWALGVRSTAHWGGGLGDVTNQYVVEGVTGGVWALMLFTVTVIVPFVYVGRAWRRFDRTPPLRIYCWAIGVALWAHAVSFLAICYFGQITMLWYMSLALSASLLDMPLPSSRRCAPSRFVRKETTAAGAMPSGWFEGLISPRSCANQSLPGVGSVSKAQVNRARRSGRIV